MSFTGYTLKKMRLIMTLIERDGYDCPLCDVTLNHGPINIDHLIPQAHGGTLGEDNKNVRVTHVKCNFERGHSNCPECVKENEELCEGRIKKLQQLEKKKLERLIRASKQDPPAQLSVLPPAPLSLLSTPCRSPECINHPAIASYSNLVK